MSSLASAGARLCALALLANALVSAALRPSFFLEHCVWHATDIVVVRPVETLNRFQVVETIKGGLASGDLLNVPGLASTKGAGRTLEELADGDRTGPLDFEHVFVDPPPVQPDDRLILFLRKASAPDGSIEWQPASPWNHLLTSALWLQRGSVYADVPLRCGSADFSTNDQVFDVLRATRRVTKRASYNFALCDNEQLGGGLGAAGAPFKN